MAPLAQLLTSVQTPGPRTRRATGLALLGAAAFVLSLGLAQAGQGGYRITGLWLTPVSFVFLLVQLWLGQTARGEEAAMRLALARLANRLPPRWYLLCDLTVPSSWGAEIAIQAVIVGPGGMAVIQPFAGRGELVPCGDVWMTGRQGALRSVRSPALECWLQGEALKEVAVFPGIPVWPVVALTQLDSVYHPADTEAVVVGAPHLAEAVRRCLAAPVLSESEVLQVVTGLCRFQGGGA